MKQQDHQLTRGAKRTLGTFANAMKDSLVKQSFETINVNHLCEVADYPRSTFYNYFEDKYDLLDYCFSLIIEKIDLAELASGNERQLLLTCFDRLYQLADQHNSYVTKMMAKNHDGYLQTSFTNCARQAAQQTLVGKISLTQGIPDALVIDHCSSNITK